MNTSEGWKVVIISVQSELAYIYDDQKIIMPRLIHPSTSVADLEFFVLSSISESRDSLLKFTYHQDILMHTRLYSLFR